MSSVPLKMCEETRTRPLTLTDTVTSLLNEVRWFSEWATGLTTGSGTGLRVRRSFSGFVIVQFPEGVRDRLVRQLQEVENIDLAYVPRFFETYDGVLRGHYPDICGSPLPDLVRISLGARSDNLALVTAMICELKGGRES